MSGDDGAGPLKNVSFLYFDSIDGALTATPHPTEFVWTHWMDPVTK